MKNYTKKKEISFFDRILWKIKAKFPLFQVLLGREHNFQEKISKKKIKTDLISSLLGIGFLLVLYLLFFVIEI